MTHTAFYLAYILLFWILLTGSQLGVFTTTAWPWMYREGTLEVCYLHLCHHRRLRHHHRHHRRRRRRHHHHYHKP